MIGGDLLGGDRCPPTGAAVSCGTVAGTRNELQGMASGCRRDRTRGIVPASDTRTEITVNYSDDPIERFLPARLYRARSEVARLVRESIVACGGIVKPQAPSGATVIPLVTKFAG